MCTSAHKQLRTEQCMCETATKQPPLQLGHTTMNFQPCLPVSFETAWRAANRIFDLFCDFFRSNAFPQCASLQCDDAALTSQGPRVNRSPSLSIFSATIYLREVYTRPRNKNRCVLVYNTIHTYELQNFIKLPQSMLILKKDT